MDRLAYGIVFCFGIIFTSAGVAIGDLSQTPLTVGFIGPFSGNAQEIGAAVRNGFELALEELGDGSIRVVYEDDQFLPAKTVHSGLLTFSLKI